MSESANLQRLTVKQAAQLLNVSERSIYSARRVVRLGRHDLVAKMQAGELTVHAALRIAENKPRPTTWDRLVRAWNNATDDDRGRFLLCVAPELLNAEKTEGE
jgi:hypothetical protein